MVMRPVSKDKRSTYHPGLWASPLLRQPLGLLRLRLEQLVPASFRLLRARHGRRGRNDDLQRAAKPARVGGPEQTKNPKTLQKFVEDLVKECVKELHKQGLARKIAK